MDAKCFIYIIVNAVAYILLFVVYQVKKKTIDLGTVILCAWIVGSIGSVYYYTFEVAYISYKKINVLPLLYLLLINLIVFYPFLKTKYEKYENIEVEGFSGIFKIMSIFFGLVSILPLCNLIINVASFSLVGAALAEMYHSEEDKVTLIFNPAIKPFFSVLRHFTTFIIFLFFYGLTKKKKNILIIIGLSSCLITFFLVALLTGNRGGIVSLAVTCIFYFFMMRSMFSERIYRRILRFGLWSAGMVFIGLALISLSRISDISNKRGREFLMDQWISQYAGEGIIQFSDMVWHTNSHLLGTQTFPYFFAFVDEKNKDLEATSAINEQKLGIPTTVFYTYIGDFVIDFGAIGTIFAAIIFSAIIRWLMKKRKGRISFYRIVILSFPFTMITIGFTANLYRTYYTQIQIIDILLLLFGLYCFQLIHKRIYGKTCNSHTCV